MKKKHLISLTIGLTFVAMAITGILMYFKFKNHEVEITHTLVGLLFTGFAVFHILNNWGSIVGYSKERKTGKIQKELIYAGVIAGVVVIGGVTEILEPVAEVGAFLKEGGEAREDRKRPAMFDEIKTNETTTGTDVTLIIQKPREAHEADLAIWVEDSAHVFVDNLLSNGADLPTYKSKAKDAKVNFEGEAPHDSFILSSKTTAKRPCFVMLEIEKGGKVELYEAQLTGAGAFVLRAKDGQLLTRGLVQL